MNKLRQYRAVIITLFLSFAFLLVDYFTDPGNPVLYLKWFIGTYFTYLAAEVTYRFNAISYFIENPLRGIDGVACVNHLDEQEFYARFLDVIKHEATDCVRISYMHDEPPKNLEKTCQKEYYNSLHAVVTSKSHIQFKRLILASSKNAAWIECMRDEFKGLRNFDLHIIDSSTYIKPTQRPLSVQCVDTTYTFLVAVSEQEQVTGERDLVIKDPAFTDKFAHYYKGLFDTATPVLSQGKIQSAGEKMLKNLKGEHISNAV